MIERLLRIEKYLQLVDMQLADQRQLLQSVAKFLIELEKDNARRT